MEEALLLIQKIKAMYQSKAFSKSCLLYTSRCV